MSLLLELNADLPNRFPNDERRLYVFSCRRKACNRKSGSIRALRAVRRHKDAKGSGAKELKVKQQQEAEKEKEKAKPKAPEPAAPSNLGTNLFGGPAPSSGNANPFSSNSNPFSTSSAGSGLANPFASTPAPSTLAAKPPQKPTSPEPKEKDPTTSLAATFADKARISSSTPTAAPNTPKPTIPQEPWPSDTSFPNPYPHYNLDADYECLTATEPTIPQNVRIEDPIIEDATSSSSNAGGGKEDKETFESALDKTFMKFSDRLDNNPEQVLRYEFEGSPLLYSDSDAVGKLFSSSSHSHGDANANAKVSVVSSDLSSKVPRCACCGANRVFEVQLVPHMITELEREFSAAEGVSEGMEWGSVIVCVCSEDCVEFEEGVSEDGLKVGYVEEWVGVQWEEVLERR